MILNDPGLSPRSRARSTTATAASGYTHFSGFSVPSYGRVGPRGSKGMAGSKSEAAFLAQSTLTPEELDGILKVSCSAPNISSTSVA